jgi:hypothetical protein
LKSEMSLQVLCSKQFLLQVSTHKCSDLRNTLYQAALAIITLDRVRTTPVSVSGRDNSRTKQQY